VGEEIYQALPGIAQDAYAEPLGEDVSYVLEHERNN